MGQYPCYSVCLVLSQVEESRCYIDNSMTLSWMSIVYPLLHNFVTSCTDNTGLIELESDFPESFERVQQRIYSNGVQWRYNTSWWPLINLHLLSLLSQSHFIHSKKTNKKRNIYKYFWPFVLTLKNVQFCSSFLTCLCVTQQCIPPHSECSEADR